MKKLVRGSLEEILNELLEQEAERLTQAAQCKYNETWQGYRNWNLTTIAGSVTSPIERMLLLGQQSLSDTSDGKAVNVSSNNL